MSTDLILEVLGLAGLDADDLPDDLNALYDLRCAADTIASRLRALRALIDKAIAAELQGVPGHAVRFGETVLMARPGRKWEWDNPDGLVEWLGADAGRAINGRYVRKGDVEYVARIRARHDGRDEATAVQMVLDSFGRYEEDGAPLTASALDRSPKWTAKLPDRLDSDGE